LVNLKLRKVRFDSLKNPELIRQGKLKDQVSLSKLEFDGTWPGFTELIPEPSRKWNGKHWLGNVTRTVKKVEQGWGI